jgi:DNA invertase Pin-like site-specific DNA recombinase
VPPGFEHAIWKGNFQIIGAMAEFERALIQERVKAGLRNARAKGRLKTSSDLVT